MPGGTVRTYLFADLRDYTLFVERRGDTAAARLLRAYRRLVRAQVALRRGAEVHTEGDSFYVVFRTPGDAIRCALGIVRGARRHNTTHPELPLQIGIGINTGEAVAHGGGYVGSAVIVASRLAQQARPGQILVTDSEHHPPPLYARRGPRLPGRAWARREAPARPHRDRGRAIGRDHAHPGGPRRVRRRDARLREACSRTSRHETSSRSAAAAPRSAIASGSARRSGTDERA